MVSTEGSRERLATVLPHLNERQRRLTAAVEARALGYGGVSAVANATGFSRGTIHRALRELAHPPTTLAHAQIRVRGAGRPRLVDQQPDMQQRLQALVESSTRGDPMSPLLWTCASTTQLATALCREGYPISPDTVGRVLTHMGYSLQANMKSLADGADHPERDDQFRYLTKLVRRFQTGHEPVISVDTKKKELIGPYHNRGRTWRPHGQPEKVKIHDFIDPDEPKAIPYGIYDVARNHGWVNVGCDHDTASFAAGSIYRWWMAMGSRVYPQAREVLICADAGGSNGYRIRLWKVEVQALADKTGLRVTVCHLPPGTSKWNKIEHRLFSHISMNWRGRPLTSHEIVVKLIGATVTKTGLKVNARLDRRKYPTKVKVTDEQMRALNIKPHAFHGEWNYTIEPKNTQAAKPKKA
ncbi:MAG: transposase [Acidobacteria bacterium RIFCSPLOWO2_12_FULL_65_11]|nr:MAG: transposase [Acidobacteria bacterium RIFCSPLOWO2_02_FULL_64_15]OFW31569.1 MAG: transposase [Acidobacteria bacterium RIFCSPLOWO2_12_FULL_65_11]